jgi:GT2 family glycosyltransferase
MITVVTVLKNIDEEYFISHINKTCALKDIDFIIYKNEEKPISLLYNEAIKNSKYNIVVFINENIEFTTSSWGYKLLKNFNKKPEYGILGIVGSKEIDENGEWQRNIPKLYGGITNINQATKEAKRIAYSNTSENSIDEVITLYHIMFAIDKNKINNLFDIEYNIDYFYDTDFFINNYINNVKIGVISNIKIAYNTDGADYIANTDFNSNKKLFMHKINKYLPIKLKADIPYDDIKIKLNNQPKISIIILTNDKYELISKCLESIIHKTLYNNYTIYIADTGSSINIKNKLKENFIIPYADKIKLIEYDYYNFAKINNDIVKNHIDKDTELILFSNNDIELINDSISIMAQTYITNKKNAGTIGCRLHYADGYLQHLGIKIIKNHNNDNYEFGHVGVNYDFNKIQCNSIIKSHGNTAAFVLILKELFEKYNGFNESYLVCFEDVELNLMAILDNKINYTCTNAVNYHYESQTRGRSVKQEDYERICNFVRNNNLIF